MKIASTEEISYKNEIDLSIIVPVYNNVNFTKSLVQDLVKLPDNCEIIIVDNNSQDNTEEVMSEFLDKSDENKAKLIYIRCPDNLMHSGGCNKGFKESTGRNILFLNNDVRVQFDQTGWWKNLTDSLTENCLIGPTFGYLRDDFSFIKESSEVENHPHRYLSGWCLAGTRLTFERLLPSYFYNSLTKKIQDGICHGPWAEDLFYFNDCDLAFRAQKNNIELKNIKLPLVHFGKMTTKKYCDVNKLYLEGKEKFTQIWKDKV